MTELTISQTTTYPKNYHYFGGLMIGFGGGPVKCGKCGVVHKVLWIKRQGVPSPLCANCIAGFLEKTFRCEVIEDAEPKDTASTG